MNLTKLPMRDVCDTLEFPDMFAIEDRPSIAVAKAPDHAINYCTYRVVCEASDAGRHTAAVTLLAHPGVDKGVARLWP